MSLYFKNLDKKWSNLFSQESKKEYFIKLNNFIQSEIDNKEIYPPMEDTFNAFKLTPFNEVKVVIIGQDPYHGKGQAHGLAFSVNEGIKVPPSLRNIFKELHNDLGITPRNNGNLTEWAKQGVLLLNTILTVEAHKPLSHKNKGWEIFTNKIISELNKDESPKVFILWGNNAIKKSDLITNPNHLIITTSHPSPLSARHSFFGSKIFTKTNDFLERGQLGKIDFN
jgi:uracil-DNA glycosylase